MKTYNVYTTAAGDGDSFLMTAPLDVICHTFNCDYRAISRRVDAHFAAHPHEVIQLHFNERGPTLRGRYVGAVYLFPPDVME